MCLVATAAQRDAPDVYFVNIVLQTAQACAISRGIRGLSLDSGARRVLELPPLSLAPYHLMGITRSQYLNE